MSETVKISAEQLEILQNCFEDNNRCRSVGIDRFSAWAGELHPDGENFSDLLALCTAEELGQFVGEILPPPKTALWAGELAELVGVLVHRVRTAEKREFWAKNRRVEEIE